MKKNILLLLFIPFATFAQGDISDERYQEVVLSVIQHINDYESASKFTTRKRSEFKPLFEYPSTKIVNDIPALGKYSELITVDEYYNHVVNYYTKLRVKVSIVDITDFNLIDENRGTLKVVISKSVKGENTQNKIDVLEDGEKGEAYVVEKDDFLLNIYLSFSGNSVKITSITPAKEKGHLLVLSPHSKTIMNRKDNNWNAIDEFSVLIDGEKVYIDDYFYCISDIDKKTKIKIESNDERLIGNHTINLNTYNKNKDNHLYKIPFTKTIGDLTAFTVFPNIVSQKIKLSSNNYNTTITDNSNLEYGLSASLNIDDFIFKTSEKKKNKRGSLYLKVVYTKQSLDYDINIPYFTSNYNEQTFEDIDGGLYRRNVELFNYNENQKLDIDNVSGMLEYRFKYTPKKWKDFAGLISFSGGFGKSSVYNGKFTNSASSIYSGTYKEDLYNITFSENGVYDFGNFENTDTGNINTKNSNFFLGDFLVMFKYKDRVLFDVGFNYIQYQENIFVDPEDDWISFDSNELNSMLNLFDVDISNLSLKAGLSIKF